MPLHFPDVVGVHPIPIVIPHVTCLGPDGVEDVFQIPIGAIGEFGDPFLVQIPVNMGIPPFSGVLVVDP